MSKSISLDLLTVIEHESRNFIWNNKIICIFAAKIYRLYKGSSYRDDKQKR